MISLDTETTGLDLYHGARPYFVTTCAEDGTQSWWEWDVDPLTRQPIIPPDELREVNYVLAVVGSWGGGQFDAETQGRHVIVLQNAKFDATALAVIGLSNFPWAQVRDTLIAGHLLASSQPHDLTSMCLHYLGLDIEPYEKRLKQACEDARKIAMRQFPDWQIAKKGLPGMPSAKGSCWKYDGWMPRAVAKRLQYPEAHPWFKVLADYANTDSAATLALWRVQEQELKRLDLWGIYLEKLRALPIVPRMERTGVTLNRRRLHKLREEFSEESDRLRCVCENIAEDLGYDLHLPKSGNNQSLKEFCFGPKGMLGLPPSPEAKKHCLNLPIVARTDTGEPSLDKDALDAYKVTLPVSSPALVFVTVLGDKRKRDTAVSYMTSYERFWLPLPGAGDDWYVLHPSLNPTGTATTRYSSSNPNEQNISKKEGFNLRYCFGPAPGREWWSLDAKNIELRIPSYEIGEQELINLFEHSDKPPYYGSMHLLNFHTVYPDIWEAALAEVGFDKVGPWCKKRYASTWYQWCKNGGLAVQYGAIDRDDGSGTADRAFHRPGSHRRLVERFSRLAQLNQRWINYADKHGYVETLPNRSLGHRRGYPLMCTRTEYGRILPTVPLNYHVQGSAGQWTERAMVRCQDQLDEWNHRLVSGQGEYLMVMQVHDEIVFDFPAGSGLEPWLTNLPKIRQLQALMAKGGDDIGVPTPVGVEYHADNWAEGRSI